MAARRAVTPSRYSDADLGSPDPLAEDFIEVVGTNGVESQGVGRANKAISGSEKRRSEDIGTTSPKLTSEHNLSPWRVKVTIEAEPENDPEDMAGAPTRAVKRTILVPLNDVSASGPPPRPGRRQSRKSVDKSTSPARRRRPSVTDLNAVVLGDDGEENEWTGKPSSPRKRRSSMKKSCKSASTAQDFEVRQDSREGSPTDTVQTGKEDTPEMREIDLNTLQAKARSDTKKQVEEWSQAHRARNTRTASGNSAMSYPTPSPTASEHGDDNNIEDDNIPQNGLDTMMESEGFTMIDLDTLPSMKQIRNTPDYPTIPEIVQEETEEQHDSEQPSIAVTADEAETTTELTSSPPGAKKTRSKPYSIGHLQLPSSTNVQRHRLVTPMPRDGNPYSSPALPTPPAAPAPVVADRSPIHSDQAVEATNMLQHAVTPEKDLSAGQKVDEVLFSGFSNDTRRELRAELRFGEALGEKHDSTSSKQYTADKASLESSGPEHDNNGDDGGADFNETTIGDIWLAEANKPEPSSPGPETNQQTSAAHVQAPRRKLIPSPWKRGQQLEQSSLSASDTVSGLFWQKQTKTPRFGEAFVGDELPIAKPRQTSDRRRSGMYNVEQMTIETPRRMTEREEVEDDQDIEDENFDSARADLQWRNAAEVVDEETNELELGQEEYVEQDLEPEERGHTKLYETNLENVPDQDLSSPREHRHEHEQDQLDEHDSTYSSISEDSPELYRQRTSLSPSKERPNTPRSALKGGRASFGQVLRYGSEQTNDRKVVWARKSSCMNEHWEESSTSIRSNQTVTTDNDTPTPRPGLNLEASFEVDPQLAEAQASNKGWFGWFNKNDEHSDVSISNQQAQHSSSTASLALHEANQDADFAPTSRHALSATHGTENTPSYLLPPSYPSDPIRDTSVPLSTSGEFRNTHFRTLHIIYRKSQRSRFHAPNFPDEIRPSLLNICGKENWKLDIDESATMGEDGLFEFSIGVNEARVLERFMREVEHGHTEKVKWGWDVEDLAENLGRLAVGEKIREEEKEAARIMGGVKDLKM